MFELFKRQLFFQRASQLVAVILWIILILLSFLPTSAHSRICHIGVVRDAAAYFLAAGATRIAFPMLSRLQVGAFAIAAAAVETFQSVILGRQFDVGDWVASSFGALLGIVVGRILSHRQKNRQRSVLP